MVRCHHEEDERIRAHQKKICLESQIYILRSLLTPANFGVGVTVISYVS